MGEIMKYILYLSTILLILTSGTVYFSIEHGNVFLVLFFALSCILFVRYKKIHKKNLSVLLIIYVLLIANTLVNVNYKVDIETLINFTIKLFFVMIFCSNVKLEDFKSMFINIIVVMCVSSLLWYGMSELLGISLPMQQLKNVKDITFFYTPYHTLGWATLFHRNAGMFWEPGAYQIFINLALLFLFDQQNFNKRNKIKCSILMITLITTKSTTGYIIFALVLVNCLNISSKKSKIKVSKGTNIIVLVIAAAVAITTLLSNSVIIDKFNEENQSFIIRQKDLFQSINIVKEKPLMGYGVLSDELFYKQKAREIGSNSNGILYFVEMIGIVGIILFSIILFRNSKYLFENVNYKIFIIIIVLFHLTEVIVFMPISIIFLFKFDSKKINVKGVGLVYENSACSK
jgi:hypothetical protein